MYLSTPAWNDDTSEKYIDIRSAKPETEIWSDYPRRDTTPRFLAVNLCMSLIIIINMRHIMFICIYRSIYMSIYHVLVCICRYIYTHSLSLYTLILLILALEKKKKSLCFKQFHSIFHGIDPIHTHITFWIHVIKKVPLSSRNWSL